MHAICDCREGNVLVRPRRSTGPGHTQLGTDFAEGVRGLLVDKDQAPQWADASLADVDPAVVAAAFGD